MSLTDGKANARERTQMTLPKTGPRPAKLTGIIDIGVHQQEYKGEKKKPRHEFIPIFTLLKDTYETEEGEVRNCSISPYSIKHMPGATRGGYFEFCNALDPQHEILNDKLEGNVFELIGRNCFVSVIHTDAKDDKDGFVYPRMRGVSEIPDDYPVDDLDFVPLTFNLDEPDKEVFASLYTHTQDRIRASIGYVGSDAEKVLDGEGADDCRPADPSDENPY